MPDLAGRDYSLLTNLRISHKRLELREHTKVEFDVSKVCNCSHIDSPVWFLTFLTCIPLFPNSQARLLAAFHLPLPRAGFITQTMRPLLNALASGQIHIKLSAPGRFSARPAPHTDVQDLVRRCLELGADQCLWANDWPQLPTEEHVCVAFYNSHPYAKFGRHLPSWLFGKTKLSNRHENLCDKTTIRSLILAGAGYRASR